MIAKKFRVPAETFSKKPQKSALSEHFHIKTFLNGYGYNRFGAVIGIKVDKRSVGRHFWKRYILDTLKKISNINKETTRKDFIVFTKPGLSEISKKKAEKELKEIFLKVNRQK